MVKSDEPSLSQLLTQTVMAGDGDYVSIRELLAGIKTQALALMLILFALPNIPPSLPGTSAITGLPLVILTLQMMLGQTLWLPQIIAHRAVPRAGLLAVLRWADPYFDRIERLLRPRALILTSPAAKNLLGGLMLILSLIIMLPIPLGNTMPALAVVIIALGLAQRDGLFVVLGLVTALVSVAGLVLLYWQAVLLALRLLW